MSKVAKNRTKFDPLHFLEVKGVLKYILLHILEIKPMHGYGIIQLISKECGGLYTPSPGVIYPALQHMEKEGLIRHKKKDGKKVYFITEKGKKLLEEHREEVERIVDKSARVKELIMNLNLKSLILAFTEVFKALPYLSEEEKMRLKEIFEKAAEEIKEILRGHRNGSN